MKHELELILNGCTSENIDAVIEEVSRLQQDLRDLQRSYEFDYNRAIEELPVRDVMIEEEQYTKYEVQMGNLEYLLAVRDIYRQGWKPTATDKGWAVCLGESTRVRYCIVFKTCCFQTMSFPTRELAEKFKKEFDYRMFELEGLR